MTVAPAETSPLVTDLTVALVGGLLLFLTLLVAVFYTAARRKTAKIEELSETIGALRERAIDAEEERDEARQALERARKRANTP